MDAFEKEQDYIACERIWDGPVEVRPLRVCSYCLMPNRWHFALWPEHDGDLATFLQRLTITHVRCWEEHRHCVGRRKRDGFVLPRHG
ncbi:MAG: hypothetical protein O3C40_29545 [Planctomycetota bacterium]|nr:hypothetical protein [Planctomycetota bacterium]